MPLAEVVQVKLKLLAWQFAAPAPVVGRDVVPRRFTSVWVARCPNFKEQGCRDLPESCPLQAPPATSDAKVRASSMHAACSAAVLRSGGRRLDNQKIRGSGAITTMWIDQMHPTVQRIIVLGIFLLMASNSFGPSCVLVTLCPSYRGRS